MDGFGTHPYKKVLLFYNLLLFLMVFTLKMAQDPPLLILSFILLNQLDALVKKALSVVYPTTFL